MKECIVFMFLLFQISAFSQSAVGVWKVIDDKDGEANSHIEVFEKDGKLHGKVVRLLQKDDDIKCALCPGDKKDQPVLGMEIIWDMKKKGDQWKGGRIMDPEDGKTYKCKIKLDGTDKLKVRGYIGLAVIGRTQTWHRIAE